MCVCTNVVTYLLACFGDARRCNFLAVLQTIYLTAGETSPATDPAGLAEVMPSSANAYEAMAPPVRSIAEGTPYAVPAASSKESAG